ncbi:hypothetical protein BU23DRAFT_571144 [Bimuria novae-zelandiae CBS 107.79]|uniref:Uncharacterized protein n=1 Tax=Bimuria novae-zelandiae CBS 107.79 TaxID=1447943 RepID=A0A6A5UZE7_9PLEO|nr:hypothetical protein BU23DRAFT_571144 [Bimuria novae-zelandiae CBS 107.79]
MLDPSKVHGEQLRIFQLNQQTSPLLRLPGEIRNEIWGYTFCDRDKVLRQTRTRADNRDKITVLQLEDAVRLNHLNLPESVMANPSYEAITRNLKLCELLPNVKTIHSLFFRALNSRTIAWPLVQSVLLPVMWRFCFKNPGWTDLRVTINESAKSQLDHCTEYVSYPRNLHEQIP